MNLVKEVSLTFIKVLFQDDFFGGWYRCVQLSQISILSFKVHIEMGDKLLSYSKRDQCSYKSTKSKTVLNHFGDKHSLWRNFSYKCGIPGCLSSYTNLQSFYRHAK